MTSRDCHAHEGKNYQPDKDDMDTLADQMSDLDPARFTPAPYNPAKITGTPRPSLE